MTNVPTDSVPTAGDSQHVKVAVVQAESVYFDLQGAVKKAIEYITEAAAKGVELVAFPEVWIPGYPYWIWYVHHFAACLSLRRALRTDISKGAWLRFGTCPTLH